MHVGRSERNDLSIVILVPNVRRSHSSIRCSLNDNVARWYCFIIYIRCTTNGRLGHLGVMDVENVMTRQ